MPVATQVQVDVWNIALRGRFLELSFGNDLQVLLCGVSRFCGICDGQIRAWNNEADDVLGPGWRTGKVEKERLGEGRLERWNVPRQSGFGMAEFRE